MALISARKKNIAQHHCMAARWGHEEMVVYLLKQGADPNKAAAPWARPLAWARKKGHKQVEEILLKAGAN
jgi:ankyrin repeat protein